MTDGENDEPCMCGTPFTCLADEHDMEVAMTNRPSSTDEPCSLSGTEPCVLPSGHFGSCLR